MEFFFKSNVTPFFLVPRFIFRKYSEFHQKKLNQKIESQDFFFNFVKKSEISKNCWLPPKKKLPQKIFRVHSEIFCFKGIPFDLSFVSAERHSHRMP